MSGINSTVRITDGMSPALRSMNNALNMVLSTFERMQNATGEAVDTTDIVNARNELNNAAVAVNRLEEELNQAGREQEEFTQEVRNSESEMSGLVGKVAGLVATYASLQTLMSAVNMSDQMAQTESRLKLIVEPKQDGSLENLEQEIFDSANRARADYEATADAVVKLANNAGNAFSSNKEIITFLEAVNKQFVIGGAEASAMEGAMTQLTQGLAAGALRGDELNSVLEGAPGIARAIEKSMGWAQGSIKSYAEEGLVTSEVVKNAMLGSLGDINDQFDRMSWTWGQLFTVFTNHAKAALEPVLKKINELANNKDVQKFALGLTGAISVVGVIALNVFEVIARAGTFIYENWSLIAPIIFFAAGALLWWLAITKGVTLAQTVLSGVMGAFKAVQTFVSIGWGVLTGNTAAASAAQFTYNNALLACPLTWILLVIIAIIAAIYLIVAAYNKLTDSSISATGIIVGVLTSAVAFVYNLFLGLLDLVLGIINVFVNQFIMFANFFGNLFNDPIGSIINLFGDMADSILGILETIANAMDKLFGTSLADSVSSWRDGLDELVKSAASEYGNGSYEKIMEEINLSSEDLGLERWAYTDAFDNGYSKGKSIESSIGDMLGGGDTNDIYKSLMNDELTSNVADTAENTGAIKDSMEITDEDLKYLRDLAEQEAINRFTTAEIKIDMQNNNSISTNMDIDGIVSQLEEKLYETMEVAAEGVH